MPTWTLELNLIVARGLNLSFQEPAPFSHLHPIETDLGGIATKPLFPRVFSDPYLRNNLECLSTEQLDIKESSNLRHVNRSLADAHRNLTIISGCTYSVVFPLQNEQGTILATLN